MTIPELPYGFTAVSCAKANNQYDGNWKLAYQRFTAFLTAVGKDGHLLMYKVNADPFHNEFSEVY